MQIKTCEECGTTGKIGGEIAPYSFVGKITRWLCTPFTGRQCRDIRYQRMREYLQSKGE